MSSSGSAAPSSNENAEWQCSSTYADVRSSVIPSLHPPSGGVAVQHELTALLAALAAPVIATVSVVPPIAGESLGTNCADDRDRASAPKNAARRLVMIDVNMLRRFQETEHVLGRPFGPDVVLGRTCADLWMFHGATTNRARSARREPLPRRSRGRERLPLLTPF